MLFISIYPLLGQEFGIEVFSPIMRRPYRRFISPEFYHIPISSVAVGDLMMEEVPFQLSGPRDQNIHLNLPN